MVFGASPYENHVELHKIVIPWLLLDEFPQKIILAKNSGKCLFKRKFMQKIPANVFMWHLVKLVFSIIFDYFVGMSNVTNKNEI